MTTAAVVAYHSLENEIRISYAGHPPVLYKPASGKTWAYAKRPKITNKNSGVPLNIPLALDLETQYAQLKFPMRAGDRLFVYTDGITEAPNPDRELFGFKRLKDILDANSKASLSELKTTVLSEINQFITKEPYHDDITLIALEVVDEVKMDRIKRQDD